MSYRCGVCRNAVPPKTPMLRHIVFKPGLPRKIQQEVPVCEDCSRKLGCGRPLAELIYRTKEVVPIGLNAKGIDFDHW